MLYDQVSNDIKEAMKARDKVRLETLRNIKKVFIEAKTAPGANDTLLRTLPPLRFSPNWQNRARSLPTPSSPRTVRTSPTRNWHR